MKYNVTSLTIVGGGTAGLVAALIMKQRHPILDVTVLESSEIGIIGVGEGSTEHWTEFINTVRINLSELLKETAATSKTGIKFTNWNGGGQDDSYFHSVINPLDSQYVNGLFSYWSQCIIEDAHPHDLVPYRIPNSLFVPDDGPGSNQFHFDTFKLNKFLHKKCSERGIKFVDAVVSTVKLDEQGYVDSLVDEKGIAHKADFFIDASGFNRVIMKHLGAQWIDCKKYLPMNHALAFPTPAVEGDFPSYTESTAMDAGWMWRIPTQERFGNGYVFCDDYITKDQAYAEIEKKFGSVEIGRDIKFGAGYLDRCMIKNCVAMGLAGIFVEPLEASSIGCTILQADALSTIILHHYKGDEAAEKQYNRTMTGTFKNIIDYIQLHYMTQRNDTAFWKDKPFEVTEFNKETLEMLKNTTPSLHFMNQPYTMFKHVNWFMVMYGLKMFNKERIAEIYANQPEEARLTVKLFFETNIMHYKQAATLNHRQGLDEIMSGKYDLDQNFNVQQ
jgi:tryptophan halogenase